MDLSPKINSRLQHKTHPRLLDASSETTLESKTIKGPPRSRENKMKQNRILRTFLIIIVVVSFLFVLALGKEDEPLNNEIKNRLTDADSSDVYEGTVLSDEKPHLNMTLCTGKCVGDCKSYITPVSECYNSGDLFPGDPNWSGLDVLDTVICQTLVRTIFQTSNGTCQFSDSDDRFQIPLEECVGPFGKPRPWGTFTWAKNDAPGEDYFEQYECETLGLNNMQLD